MSWSNEEALIGKAVTSIDLSPDRETLTLTCSDGSVIEGRAHVGPVGA